MADESIVAAILQELEETREKLQQTEKELEASKKRMLESRIRRSLTEHDLKSLPDLISFSSQDMKFCVHNRETIEFPSFNKEEVLAMPPLLKQQSSNSLLQQQVGKAKGILSEYSQIQNDLAARISEINERAKSKVDKLKSSAENTLKDRKETVKELLQEVSEELQGSYLCETHSERVYQIDSVIVPSFSFKLTQLKDNNGISLERPRKLNKPFTFLENTYLLHRTEDECLEEKKLLIEFQVAVVEDSRIFCPISIRPDGIPVQQYEIKFVNYTGEISGVLNKTDGPVKFDAFEFSQDCGLVKESVVEIFTVQVSPNVLNILHMHINDTQEEAAFDAVYILEDQSPSDYAEWQPDARGLPLRYKVIIKNGKVEAILYNTGNSTDSVPFIERRLEVGELVKFNNMIAKINLLPTGMLARNWQSSEQELTQYLSMKPALAYCSKRHVEELPGLADLQIVISQDQYTPKGEELALPVCQCVELTDSEQAEAKDIIENFIIQAKHQFETNILELGKLLKQFTDGSADDKVLLESLQRISGEVKDWLDNNKRLIKNYSRILQNADKAIRILATRSRFS